MEPKCRRVASSLRHESFKRRMLDRQFQRVTFNVVILNNSTIAAGEQKKEDSNRLTKSRYRRKTSVLIGSKHRGFMRHVQLESTLTGGKKKWPNLPKALLLLLLFFVQFQSSVVSAVRPGTRASTDTKLVRVEVLQPGQCGAAANVQLEVAMCRFNNSFQQRIFPRRRKGATITSAITVTRRSNMDPTAEVGHENGLSGESGAAKMQERLQKRHQARIEEVERRKEAKENQSVAEEKGEYFSSTFATEQACVEELLSSCSGADRAAVTQRLEEATARTVQLQKFLNDSMLFLTQYKMRQAQAALQSLQTSIAEIREKALPKKKFAFGARSKGPGNVPAPVSDAAPPDAAPPADSGEVDGADASEQCFFSNMDDEFLTKTSEEIQKRDVLLSHLSNCKVRLFGSPSTLHLKHIDSCEILCGPVSTSVFVDSCRNSTLAFACQQLRTHNTTDTQVYLHVTSRAIVEDCHRVSVAPFSWSYPTLDEDFTASGLDRDRNNWSQVDDFNWLAAGIPSPNWSILPEADRKTNWGP
ncbi:tubulin-specific chaperone C isoform X1 [Scophthalmus maximus]|nr:tubulin-specific chaperone C isoform X1 [Scophthalmus maximus]